jgi:TPR repeat protein
MMTKLKSFLILKALLLPLFSVIASDQPKANENERYAWPPGEAISLSMDIEYLRQAANSSECWADSQVELGRYYFNNNGIEAFKWFKKATEKLDNDPFGTAEAYRGLGWCYKEGKGVEKDEAEAEKWLRKAEELEFNTRMAAESGDAKAQLRFAHFYKARDNHAEAFKWFKKASENIKADPQEVAAAYTWIGQCYKSGRGVKKNQSEADKYFRKGDELEYNTYRKQAEEDDAEAQFWLGEQYIRFAKSDKNHFDLEPYLSDSVGRRPYFPDALPLPEAQVESKKWFKKSAENGFAKAQNELGECYDRGDGLPKDQFEAAKWFRKAAEQGYPEAQKNLAHCYRNGEGVEKNYLEAAKWYRKAAEQGNDSAQWFLGFCYLNGEGVSVDEVEALKWFRKSAELGNDFAQVTLGECHAKGLGVPKDNAEALKWFQKASRYTWRGVDLGERYFYGKGVEKNTIQAVNFFRKAAEAGDANAQFYMGICYANGQGLEKDETESVKWYRKAADQGIPSAQYALGERYLYGKGIPKDPVEATKWFQKSAEQRNAEAEYALAVCFYNGWGVSKDLEEAMKWLRKAAAQDFKQAKEDLDKLLKEKKLPKLALLIANSNYSYLGGLARTIPDAKALANVLNSLGFEVYLLKDGSREQILDALKSFENKVRGTNALAFFHFGGHGIQVEGKNYLIPADAEVPDERRVTTRAVDLDEVIASLESAKPKASVLVVDACRHNPLPATATRSATRGLAVVGRKPKNSVIIFAAEAGNEALDGLFTPVFAKALSENRDKSLNQIMQKVRSEVFNRSNGAQTPGEYNQLFEDVYLSPNK